MMLPAFTSFFATSASAGAALVGLLFVAVSIAPHETVKASAPIERQATSASAFTALINAFFISLGALIPGSNVGIVTLLMGVLGLLNTLSLTRRLVFPWPGLNALMRRGPLVAAGLIIYGYEMYFAILLLVTPSDRGPLYGLMGLLIGVYGLGIVRAWQLLGAKRFSFLSGWLDPLKGPDEPSPADDRSMRPAVDRERLPGAPKD
jgi:hypothetical protein